MATLTWLHLSDFHFRPSQHYNANVVLEPLLRDIAERIEQDGLQPDFIAVTGDVAFSGKPEEYKLAQTFFKDLLHKANLPAERLFIVPGNHDVDRSLISRGAQLIGKSLSSRDEVNTLLATPADRKLMMARFAGYACFVNDHLPHLGFGDEQYFYVRTLDKDGRQIALLGLNSAWLCASDEDRAAGLLIGERQARAALEQARTADLKIALLHHPFDWLREFDYNDSAVMLMDGCHLILHGHLHRTAAAQLISPDSGATVIAAGACYETRQYPNSYNLVRFDFDSGRATIYLRTYSDQRGGFWTADTKTYKNALEGRFTFGPPQVAGRRQPQPRKKVSPDVDPLVLEKNYLRRIWQDNELPLYIIDHRAADLAHQKFELLPVYIHLNTQTMVEAQEPSRRRGFSMSDEEKRRPLAALEAVEREQRLALLGDPGSGKSTFVRCLAICLAGVRLRQRGLTAELRDDLIQSGLFENPPLPLFVTLRYFAECAWCNGTAAGLWKYVEHELQSQQQGDFVPYLKEQLQRGGVMVILDGLDEVADPTARQNVRAAVADFAATFNANRYVVTCRGYAYQGESRLRGFAEHTLAAFDEEQIKDFVGRWYRYISDRRWKSEQEANDLATRLQAAVRRPDIRPLAGNPLQLTMMASLHSSWGKLPDDRVALYDEMASLLLVRWQEARLGADRGIGGLIRESELKDALKQVAFVVHRAQERPEGVADISQAVLLDVLKDYCGGSWDRAREIVDYIRDRAGLLIQRDPRGVYVFPHRSYQEYMAGAYLAMQPNFPDEAARLARANFDQWRETILWGVGVVARLNRQTHLAVDVANALCPSRAPDLQQGEPEIEWRMAWLAGRALEETGIDKVRAHERYQPVLSRVQEWLVTCLQQRVLSAPDRAAAGRTLAALGDPRPGVGKTFEVLKTSKVSLPDILWVPIPAGTLLMGSRKGETFITPQGQGKPYDDEYWPDGQPRPVPIKAFYIAAYPITVAQFRLFVKDPNGWANNDWWTRAGLERAKEPYWWNDPQWCIDNHPVVGVTWYAAVAYCNWLTSKIQEAGCKMRVWREGQLSTFDFSSSTLVRLPTEAEWEWAARGTASPPLAGGAEGGRIWPWGNEWQPGMCNSEEAGLGRTSPVGMFPPSPQGIYDLAGNVWEWCSTRWQAYSDDYPALKGVDEWTEKYLEGSDSRVIRGGSFANSARSVRCAYRRWSLPDPWDWTRGFRCVLCL